MEKNYARQIIEWSELAKQTLTVRREIIMDDDTTNEQLGDIIRMMYRAKVEAENAQIERCKQFI